MSELNVNANGMRLPAKHNISIKFDCIRIGPNTWCIDDASFITKCARYIIVIGIYGNIIDFYWSIDIRPVDLVDGVEFQTEPFASISFDPMRKTIQLTQSFYDHVVKLVLFTFKTAKITNKYGARDASRWMRNLWNMFSISVYRVCNVALLKKH